MRATQRIQQNMAMISDPEVKTPEHDAIMMWLDANMEQVLQACLCPDYAKRSWKEEYLDQVFDQYVKECRHLSKRYETRSILPEPPRPRKVEIVRSKWEVPVKREQYVIGFIDMRVEFVWIKTLRISDYSDDPWSQSGDHCVVNIEVKPAIPSVGELIRQINLYREYLKGDYCVVSPDGRWVDVLKAQKIGFIACPDLRKRPDQLSLPHEP